MSKIAFLFLFILLSLSAAAFSHDDASVEKNGYKVLTSSGKITQNLFVEVLSNDRTLFVYPSFDFIWMCIDIHTLDGRLIESVKLTDAADLIDLDTDEERLYISIVTNQGYEFSGEISL